MAENGKARNVKGPIETQGKVGSGCDECTQILPYLEVEKLFLKESQSLKETILGHEVQKLI